MPMVSPMPVSMMVCFSTPFAPDDQNHHCNIALKSVHHPPHVSTTCGAKEYECNHHRNKYCNRRGTDSYNHFLQGHFYQPDMMVVEISKHRSRISGTNRNAERGQIIHIHRLICFQNDEVLGALRLPRNFMTVTWRRLHFGIVTSTLADINHPHIRAISIHQRHRTRLRWEQ